MSDLLGEELLVDAAPDEDVPEALAEFAKAEGLTEQDVKMLAAINFRGQRPQDLEAWRMLWGVIKASVR